MGRNNPVSVFPNVLPFDQPPDVLGTIAHGYRTPRYGLAWKCTNTKFWSVAPEHVCLQNLQCTILRRWDGCKGKYGLGQHPELHIGHEGDFYIQVMLNVPGADHKSHATDRMDDLVQAARHALFVDEEIDATLAWYRYPYGPRKSKYPPKTAA
ncbi:hypothetical protein AURDEDRAFT_168555 [Auricularia subglabra TFB-10046 SS5]|nr:hypothetical protein AURDEDRAFT_168555 [Auricularia subglabra TFB-10046 SS5]